MKINTAKFVISNSDVAKCPQDKLPEYAFIGRSNVGKSSLINMMTNNKKLAKTSSTPGKTQLINHFIINDEWYLVDLPGYGYARTSKKTKKVFQKFITDYFVKRSQLVSAFVLVDSRHAPQKIDLEFMEWLGINSIPFAIIFTKTDKLKKGAWDRNFKAYSSKLMETWAEMPDYFTTSSLHKTGAEEVLEYIDQINENLKSEN
jgi:GTP-binding protein